MSHTKPRRGSGWILTYTGGYFYPLDPRPDEICIEDVAHHLSQINRWGGATRKPYNDAQHCVLVSRMAPEELKLVSLLHDAPEGLGFNDMQRPIKYSSIMSGYVKAEARCWRAVAKKFGLNHADIVKIKPFDDAVALAEHRDLMNDRIEIDWINRATYLMRIKPYEKRITAWSPEKSERIFLEEFNRLMGFCKKVQ